MLSRLYRGHQAWHLAHIIIKHLSPRPASLNADLPFDLVHWMQEHNPSDLFQGGSTQPFLTDGATCRANDEWWRTLYHFIMHVYIDQAVEMLSLIGREGSYAYQCGEDGLEMVDVMISLLVGGGEAGENVSLFELENMVDNNMAIDSYWRVWTTRKEWSYLDKLVQKGASPICKKMATMVKIMKGSEDEISANAYSWLQIVVTRMLFGRSETVLGVADLASYADDALTVHGQFVRKPEDEESVIKDLLRLDMQGAVQHFFTDLKDWWSSAHLADVLYRGKYLPFSQLFASNMRTYAICNYIDILLCSNNMWQVAMAYVKGVVESDVLVDESTSVEARERWRVRRQEMLHLAHLIVSRQHIDSDVKCRHLLQYCPEDARDIHGNHLWEDSELIVKTASEIQCAWGLRLYTRGHEAASLYWLARAESKLVGTLASQSLHAFVQGVDDSLYRMQPILQYVEEAGGEDIPSEVQLIRTYSRMRELMATVSDLSLKDRQSLRSGRSPRSAMLVQAGREAAKLLLELLDESRGGEQRRAAPRRFWPELLSYSIPLIESGIPSLFSSSDMFLCLQALQDVESSFKADRRKPTEAEGMRVQSIRLALARGLSVSLQQEASTQ
uniref:Nuclear pore complex protein Nup85 n=1 Tax=Hanusia phi TaxID=3032 RepID=A0A7S0HBQ5_9CRYP